MPSPKPELTPSSSAVAKVCCPRWQLGGSRSMRLIDLGRVAELRKLEIVDDQVEIGAGCTFTDLLSSEVCSGRSCRWCC